MTTVESLSITITAPLRISGANNYLVLDPEHRKLYTESIVGNGTPMFVWHNRGIMFRLPDTFEPTSLHAWLEDNLESFTELADSYQGSDWDGNNHKGQWDPTRVSLEDEVEHALEEAFDIGSLHTYADASDYMYGNILACVQLCLQHVTLDDYAEEEVEQARLYGNTLLDTEDVLAVMRRRLESEEADLAEATDLDEADTQKLQKIRSLLTT